MKNKLTLSYRWGVNNIYKILLTALCIISCSALYATNYYVDNISGSNSNNGTATGTAWFDFTNVNIKTFLPGDQLLLKAGCVWNQELHLAGSGNSSSFIIVDMYGSGSKPKIQRNSGVNDRTVFLVDVSYFKLRNLEVSNAGDGIRIQFTQKGKSSVYCESLYIHDINNIVNASPSSFDGTYYSTGITIYSSNLPKPTSATDYVANDIRITNCEIAFTTAPVTFLHIFSNPSGPNTESPYSFKSCVIDNNNLHDFKGPISTRDLNNSLITNNNCKNGGTQNLPQGTTGFFNFNLENVVFEGNVMDNVPNTGSADQSWIDNEAYCNNVQLYGNVIKNTAGNGIEFLNCPSCQPPRGGDDYNTNNVIDGNTFANNSGGVVRVSGNGITGTLANNFYQSGNTFFNGTGFTQTNNVGTNFSSSNLALYKAYISSSVFDASQRSSKAFDGNSSSNWQSASGFTNQWLRVNFGSSVTFDSVKLSEFGNRTSGYRIEYSNDGISWQTAYTGSSIGASSSVTFTAVTASMARLFFTGGTGNPIIYEFEIYKKATSGGSGTTTVNIGNASDGITYGGSGFFNIRAGNINNDERFLTDASSYCQYTFTGTGVDVIGYKDQGSIYAANYTIYIDGSAVVNGNTSSSTNQFQVLFGSITGLSNASHTVKVGYSGAIGSSGVVILDALKIYTASGSIAVTGVSVSPTSVSLSAGSTSQLTATIAPSNATNQNVTWSTSNSAIATINASGLVTGVAAGSAVITVTTTDGTKTATSNITVNSGSSSCNWTFGANENGTVTFSGTKQVRYGANGTYFTLTATNSIGCNNSVFGDPVPGVAKTCEVCNSGSSSNLALNRTYTSSSNWDASQSADKGCDGSASTNWQAANGSTFSGQYLQVNFGAAVTFNRVTLSEYGNRTSGYRIEYSTNGTTWETATTGTTIGTSTTVNFTAVTGNYARIFFTSGANTPIIYEFEIYNTAGARPVAITQQPLSNSTEVYPFTLFPNPSGSSINAGYKLPPKSKANLSMYDVSGRIVRQINFVSANAPSGKINIDLTGLNNGIYMVQIKAGNNLITHKLIVEK